MEDDQIQFVEVSLPRLFEKEKQKWAEEHARQLQHLFEKWQKPLGIDGEEYRKYLAEDLLDCCDEPLLKSLIDSIAK